MHLIWPILGCVIVVTGVTDVSQDRVAPLLDVEQCVIALEDSDVRVRRRAIADLALHTTVGAETILRIVDICKRHHGEVGLQRTSFEALEALGPRAAPAIPFLTSVLLDEEDPPSINDPSWYAGLALRAMGPAAAPAIPSLLKALRSEVLFTRKVAIEALGAIGPEAGVAVPVLFDMALHDKGGGLIWSIQDKAKRALAKIGAPAVSLLLDALTNECDRRRELAAEVLYRMTLELPDSALSAKSSLKHAMQDKTAIVQVYSALAYWNLSREVAEVRPLLLFVIRKYIRDRDCSPDVGYPPDVEAAIIGLRHLGADAAPAVELLVEVLEQKKGEFFKRLAVETLGELGDVARPAIPRLREMSRTPGETMRAAADALLKITSNSGDENSDVHKEQGTKPQAEQPRQRKDEP